MKKLLSMLLLAAASSTASFAQQLKVAQTARFNTENVQLGKIQQGHPATATFIVTNTGKVPLTIYQTIPSCGCTTPDYTKTPILPGKTGTVTATYNAAALGTFSKSVTVKFAGVEDVATLGISGEVMPAAGTATAGASH